MKDSTDVKEKVFYADQIGILIVMHRREYFLSGIKKRTGDKIGSIITVLGL